MSLLIDFRRGDVVHHPKRPEWGDGTIEQVVAITHEGKPAQRLIINFINHGRVTINTGIAPLVPKGSSSTMSNRSASSSAAVPDWLAPSKARNTGEELYRLPDAMTDPFASWNKRLEATLDSYRYGNDARNARAILDWAVAQTLLNDPLSKYSRPELEQAFPRFVRDRDNHLHQMVRALKKQGKSDVLQQVLATTTNPAAKAALQRMMRD